MIHALIQNKHGTKQQAACVCWGGVGSGGWWWAGIITKILDDTVHMLYKTGRYTPTHRTYLGKWGWDGMGGGGVINLWFELKGLQKAGAERKL